MRWPGFESRVTVLWPPLTRPPAPQYSFSPLRSVFKVLCLQTTLPQVETWGLSCKPLSRGRRFQAAFPSEPGSCQVGNPQGTHSPSWRPGAPWLPQSVLPTEEAAGDDQEEGGGKLGWGWCVCNVTEEGLMEPLEKDSLTQG